jgi:hypothetical protein
MTDKSIYHDEQLRNEIRLKAKNDDGVDLTEAQIHLCIMLMEKMKISYFHGHMWPNRRKRDGEEVMTWALTADGHRAVARRHGLAGIDEPQWEVDEHGKLISAKVVVYRRNHIDDGPSRFERYVGVAYYDEFVERKYSGEPNYQWSRRPRNQLAKCAEMQALSRGFPETGTETVIMTYHALRTRRRIGPDTRARAGPGARGRLRCTVPRWGAGTRARTEVRIAAAPARGDPPTASRVLRQVQWRRRDLVARVLRRTVRGARQGGEDGRVALRAVAHRAAAGAHRSGG